MTLKFIELLNLLGVKLYQFFLMCKNYGSVIYDVKNIIIIGSLKNLNKIILNNQKLTFYIKTYSITAFFVSVYTLRCVAFCRQGDILFHRNLS